MEYERMREKPQGGGVSPRKLRSMLLGAEKKRSGEEEELESSSEAHQVDNGGGTEGGIDDCKDVDVVTVDRPECSTSLTSASGGSLSERKMADNLKGICSIRVYEDYSMETDSVNDRMTVPASVFEFQKSERAGQRGAAAPFSKPAPSKWDDAQKWIASPTSKRPKAGQAQSGIGGVLRKMSHLGNVSRHSNVKVVLEFPHQKCVAYEEPDTKQIDSSLSKETDEQKFVNWENTSEPAADPYCKPLQMIESGIGQINLSCHDSSMSIYGATTFIPPPSTARSVSMRDMGTEMTPIASQEPSRTGTPVRSTTPVRSPSSRPSTPGRTLPAPSPIARPTEHPESNSELSENELQVKTRREIMALGTKLGKTNIAAWASKAEEDKDASTSLKIKFEEKPAKDVIDARATAWEEAEKTKYIARFKRAEIKIQAWENHQKAKAEAEMKKAEVEVERMRALAHDRLANKLAATRHQADEKRAAAEAKWSRQAAKAAHQADYIRRTGRTPPTFSCCYWCC
uniref:Remorin C-terminal domain-containing protein n=2 Tax=Kalanchoe fedtschenkoi TaxID=63787 RepID=A0A7N0UKW7_KALFE